MPRFSVWATRLSLLYFLLGITFGAVLLTAKAYPLPPAIWALLPVHIEFLLIGWIVQFVFAVAYWILPRFTFGPKRGRQALAWLALALLNAGIGLAAFGIRWPGANWLLWGRGLEIAAVLLFGMLLWRRAKPTETGRKIS